ncbi:hypothetical protein M885DRAFT_523002 [Pelagophyceae sp. CCMP2097]|nr:hypothetical protein M885DRAFT_523002 [Pelagophyceae sp. CCMP2097]
MAPVIRTVGIRMDRGFGIAAFFLSFLIAGPLNDSEARGQRGFESGLSGIASARKTWPPSRFRKTWRSTDPSNRELRGAHARAGGLSRCTPCQRVRTAGFSDPLSCRLIFGRGLQTAPKESFGHVGSGIRINFSEAAFV